MNVDSNFNSTFSTYLFWGWVRNFDCFGIADEYSVVETIQIPF